MGMMNENWEVMLDDVRLKNENIFKRFKKNGQEGKFGFVVLLDKQRHAKQIEALKEDIGTIIAESFKGKRIASDKRCLRDGDDGGDDFTAGCWILSANSDNPPFAWDKSIPNKQLTIDDPAQIYRGCRVKVKFRLWAQDNEWGQRVNAQAIAIQFRGDDEAFGAGTVSAESAAQGFEVSDAGDEGW
ncbi:MAG: ssDNA-binding protein [Pseudomonadota bacterium]